MWRKILRCTGFLSESHKYPTHRNISRHVTWESSRASGRCSAGCRCQACISTNLTHIFPSCSANFISSTNLAVWFVSSMRLALIFQQMEWCECFLTKIYEEDFFLTKNKQFVFGNRHHRPVASSVSSCFQESK